jgi:hypothetical protein
LLLFVGRLGRAQDPSSTHQAPEPPSPVQETTEAGSDAQESRFARNVFDLFNMAGTEESKQFRPLTQSERNKLYFDSMVNPLSFVRVAASAGIDQAKDKPEEWEQGASGLGKRYANIFAQYSIQRTVTYGLASALHEDNRYFNSGKQAFWPRAGYALASGILARRDDGTRRFSFSLVGGVAAGAFLARTWLPSSQSSAADAAISFGITMGTNIGFGAAKEFVPDLVRPLMRKNKPKP